MLAVIGRISMERVRGCGRFGVFCGRLLGQLFSAPRFVKPTQWLLCVHRQGSASLTIIIVAAAFVGMVLALQGYTTLVRFGAEEANGVLLGLTLVRELGPVVAALLYAGRAGSSLAAEIGLMKATEQLAALEMMAVSPLRFVYRPRLLAGVVVLPMLAAVFSAVAIGVGYGVSVPMLGLDSGVFWSQMINGIDFYSDVMTGLAKALVFGIAINAVALYHGQAAEPNAAGVARATTAAVIYGSILVLALDFVLTAIWFA